MNIVLLGANGRTGREVLRRALDGGDRVTALVRESSSLSDITHPGLHIQSGNVCDPEVLKSVFPGNDVVISTLGPRTLTKAACKIYSDSAEAIVQAMNSSGIERILITSTALLFPSNKLTDRLLRLIARNNEREAGLMEEHIRASGNKWTSARLGFLNGNDSEDYRVAEGALPEGGGAVSRAAVANFLVTEARQPLYAGKVVGVSH